MKRYVLSLFLFSINALYAESALGPYFTGNDYAFIGTQNNNDAYALKSEDGFASSYSGPDGKEYAVELISIHEEPSLIFKKAATDSFAVYDVNGSNTPPPSLASISFSEASPGAYAVEAWKRAQNPENYLKDQKIGTKGTWVYVTKQIQDFDIVRWYIGASITRDPSTGILGAVSMAVTESRYLVEIVPSQNKYRAIPIKNDVSLSRGTAVYKDIDDSAKGILQFAKEHLQK